MANLLVRNKGDLERWVLEFGVVGQTLQQCADFSHARFIVS